MDVQVDQTFCWASSISDVANLKVKLKLKLKLKLKSMVGDPFKCKQRIPEVSK